VLLVPDSIYWVTGTIAKAIARHNPWMVPTIASGPVMDRLFRATPRLIDNFDLVHFVCPYVSRTWLPRFQPFVPCVTSHHHVTDWELVKHNADGDALVVGSAEWAADLAARGVDQDRIFCVPYGVDTALFMPPASDERAEIRRSLGIPHDATVVGFFGKTSSNDDDRKGIRTFSGAIVRMHAALPSTTPLIVGPGWGGLVEFFRSAGMRPIWIPFIRDYPGVRRMYHALDFYWVTAKVEGGPVTLLEAMSSGIPCLTTPVGLARDIVRDGENGIVIQFGDAAAFADQTAALSADVAARERLGTAARRTIIEQMDVRVTSRRVSAVYAKAIEQFERRTGRSPRATFEFAESASAPTWSGRTVPLNGFPRSVRRQARMLESLTWGEALYVFHGERREALRLITRAWFENPRSVAPARALLRRFLPPEVVAGVVRMKQATHRSS